MLYAMKILYREWGGAWANACAIASVLVLAVPLQAEEPTPRATPPATLSGNSKSAITVMRPKKGPGNGQQVTYFMNKEGRPTLTNRINAYRADPDYVEIRIAFEPIIVPGRFRFSDSIVRYTPADLQYLVQRYARQHGLEENLVLAIIKAESNFDRYAVSKVGARGLMQLMPGTAAEMKVTDIFDPAQNIAGGTQYLRKLLKLFHEDLDLALAAYNAGPSTVKRYGGIPPFKETQAYVRNVKRLSERFARKELAAELGRGSGRPSSDFLPSTESAFVVYYTNGATQPADKVYEDDPYYVIEFRGRRYTVRKDFVKTIMETG